MFNLLSEFTAQIFVPIHRGNHWCLAVINVKSKSFQYLDSFGRMDFAVLEVLVSSYIFQLNILSHVQN